MTEVSSREVQEVDYMERMATGRLVRPESPKTLKLGKYMQMDKNGWVEQNELLATVTPTESALKGFLKDKTKFVANKRKQSRLRAQQYLKTEPPSR